MNILPSGKVVKANYNKYHKNIGDCAIRAIVAGIGMDYDLVCKRFGMSWKKGHGLIRDTGIDLELIKQKFEEYFDIVEDFGQDEEFVPDNIPDSMLNDPNFVDPTEFELANGIADYSLTLSDFIDIYGNAPGNKTGRYLVGLSPNKNAKDEKCKRAGGHIVCVMRLQGQPMAVDTWDSAEMLVDCFMRIKKVLPKDSPQHWKYDYEKKRFV